MRKNKKRAFTFLHLKKLLQFMPAGLAQCMTAPCGQLANAPAASPAGCGGLLTRGFSTLARDVSSHFPQILAPACTQAQPSRPPLLRNSSLHFPTPFLRGSQQSPAQEAAKALGGYTSPHACVSCMLVAPAQQSSASPYYKQAGMQP